jgi:hypothetical protein
MAGYDDAGENPFFVSYQEATPLTRTQFPALARKVPLERAKWLMRELAPGLTPYQRDWAWKIMEQKGVLTKLEDKEFEGLVAEAVKEVTAKTAGAMNLFDKRRAS